ncbi:MAG: hypothetical protein EB150_00930 [Nitrososphaeria archaeon]|nr:hypothetical protein [Nitrososphaeria archaeon]NDB50675.1 hypothetical protein [Nitrosopumilaceae archaeon]NDB87564.1 hypothetical protein [Nitrososphaerota archaeon]NDB45781.1 hypothetical protein [Nitrososphaeria archaeon]NDB62274.1 hypothetical protein [Nitrosopumilaceae archaeon]
MLLHFIFLVTKEDLESRTEEFEYVQQMALFYKKWLKDTFSVDVDVQADQMVVPEQSLVRRLDTAVLVEDHKSRGSDVFHFYLSNFRPMWTDCTCEGYYAENFAMVLWVKPKDDVLSMCQKNCTVVSHELCHEILRQKKIKKQYDMIHDVWNKHLFKGSDFAKYGKNFEPNDSQPYFMTLDATDLRS